MDHVGDIVGGGTPSTGKKSLWDGDINWFTPTEIKTKYSTGSIRRITREGIAQSSATLLPVGTILFTSRATIGEVSIAREACTTNQGFQSFIVNDSMFSNEYLYYWLLANKKHFLRRANGSTFLEISKSEIKKIPLCILDIREQQQIAAFLSAVDTKIEQLNRKKSLLEQYKKGMMQKLFNQELRFKDEDGRDYPDWEEKELGKLCKIITGKLDANAMSDNGKYRFYTCAREYYWIDEFAFDTEALLISGNGVNVGYIHYFSGKFNAYQRTYVLDRFEENIFYIKYFLEQHLHRRISLEKKEGNTPYIVLNTLAGMTLKIPHRIEQQKIANFLSAIDKKIELVTGQIEQARSFKQGLLQQMFI